MIEQLSDSGFTSGGVCEGLLTFNEKQQPLVVKKQALRDLPNENNVGVIKSVGDSTLPKEKIHVKDPEKVTGVKRSSSDANPPNLSPSAVNANGNLVYVRRKTDAEVGKICSSVTAGNNNDIQLSENEPASSYPVGISVSAIPGNTNMSAENKYRLHPLGNSSNSTVSPENKSAMHPVGKSGIPTPSAENKYTVPHPVGITGHVETGSPLPRHVGNSAAVNSSVENNSPVPYLGKSGNILPSAENKQIPPASVTSKVDLITEASNKSLQQRHGQSRISLRGLDRSGHEEYLLMLRSLSSIELSRLAFELETRSIQLSLEEAREMARIEMLNVMGKATKPFKSPIALLSEK